MSRTFTDLKGRKWSLALDWDLHEQVFQRAGVLLLGIGDDDFELLRRFHSRAHDDCKLVVSILWILCEEQLAANGVVTEGAMTAERQFAKGLGGDSWEGAVTALVDAVVDFFQSPEQRQGLHELLAKQREIQSRAFQMALEQTTAAISQVDTDQVALSCIVAAGSTPAKPRKTRGVTRLAS